MVYVLAGIGLFTIFPLVSLVLFLWGLGGLIKGKEQIEPEDDET